MLLIISNIGNSNGKQHVSQKSICLSSGTKVKLIVISPTKYINLFRNAIDCQMHKTV